MTLKETVEYFRDMVESCGAYELFPCFKDDMEMTKIALSALEKQIPKKPIRTDWINCPSCNWGIALMKGTHHCPKCGQALDWSETE